jgi:hypothetical protein
MLDKADLVPQWMCLAERVATGSRPRVLEDGPDTLNSDEDSDKDVEADNLKGCTPQKWIRNSDPSSYPNKKLPTNVPSL